MQITKVGKYIRFQISDLKADTQLADFKIHRADWWAFMNNFDEVTKHFERIEFKWLDKGLSKGDRE